MEYLGKTCFIWITVVMTSVVAQDPSFVATFSMAGASGNVTFTQGTGETIAIGVNMILPTGTYNWAVHERPTLYDQRPACGEMFTGAVLADGGNLTAAHGQLTGNANVVAEFTNNQLNLTGVKSITGRTLVLEQTGSSTLICANILDFNSDVVTAVAQFMSPFAGTVTFRQRQGTSSAGTSILLDLYDVLGPLEETTYRWGIHSVEDYNAEMDLQERCSNTISGIFNPNSADASSCQPDLGTCPIGDLSKKFGDVTVHPVSTSRTQYFIDTSLPLNQGAVSVLGKNLVFTSSDGTFIACSPIQQLLPKTVSAKVSVSGVSGSLEFTQRSPYDATFISINLANLQGLAGGYHVHENPVTERVTKDDLPASNANVGGHYNPFNVIAADSPPAGTGTNDQYEVGDISGKFGSLKDLTDFSAQFFDWNMQLFGKYSIVGRSIVIHKQVANERWVYGNIGYPTDVKTIRADFSYVVAGKIVFRQDPNDPYSDTTIYVDVIHADGSITTNNHNFHVHETLVENDYVRDSSRCASALRHFNPFVDVKTNYDQCSFQYPSRCEVGDLSQKLSTIDIPSATGSSGKYFFTDPLLPLTGIYSVSGRSVVIHLPDRAAPRYACANLYDVPSMSIGTDTWIGGPVINGEITVSQASEFDLAKVDIQLSGLNQMAGGWHIHVLPIDTDNADGPCSAASVKGHYNPFDVVGSPATGTNDMYEVGDFSGKFGSLAGAGSISDVYMDSNVALTGPRSVAGRSMVIHRDDAQGSRMVCSDVDRTLAAGDFTLVASVTLQNELNGVVTLRQTRFASGYQGDTSLEVDLTADEGNVEYRLEIPSETCADDSIYNPYGISIVADQCSISRMRLCAVGDLVSKHGVVSSNQRVIYSDINLPLFGLNSVIGRHLAIRTLSGDKTCSSIIPDQSLGRKVSHVFPSTTEFDAYGFQTTVASAIANGNRWQVVTSEEPGQSTDFKGCSSVEFWVIGPNVDDLVTALSAAVKAGNLNSYNPTELCSEGSGGGRQPVPSGFMVLLSSILGVFVIAFLQQA